MHRHILIGTNNGTFTCFVSQLEGRKQANCSYWTTSKIKDQHGKKKIHKGTYFNSSNNGIEVKERFGYGLHTLPNMTLQVDK